MNKIFNFLSKEGHKPKMRGLELLKYIGPGLLVTVGFTDPGNWATNLEAGSTFGYALLWVITLSTIMLIVLQHNAAHLGIVTGLCMSEATAIFIKPRISKLVLITAMLAAVSTAIAEILGGAIGLQMLFKIPLVIGAVLTAAFAFIMLFNNSYKRIESWIIAFVSIVGLSFIYELWLIDVDWHQTFVSSINPVFPNNSMLIITGVLGAVIMPHNLYLHSEIIQSRNLNCQDEKEIKKQLNYEFVDTIFSMFIGWAINCAMIILAAVVFFNNKIHVTEISQAKSLLEPLLGKNSSSVFAIALLFAGFSSSITAGMAGGSIFTGLFKEPYDIKDNHTKIGIGITLIAAVLFLFIGSNPLKTLLYSQVILSIQLPFTMFSLIYLTSSKKVMSEHVNRKSTTAIVLLIAIAVTVLNFVFLASLI